MLQIRMMGEKKMLAQVDESISVLPEMQRVGRLQVPGPSGQDDWDHCSLTTCA